MPTARSERNPALLRGGRPGPAPRLRARVRRRRAELAASDELLLPALPRHRLQRARLPALGRPGGPGRLLPAAGRRRHPRAARRPGHRQGPRVRALDGRLRHPALRPDLSRPRAVAGGGGRWLRQRRPGEVQAGLGRGGASASSRAWRRSPSSTPRVRRACSSWTRTRWAGRRSATSWPPARPTGIR